MTDTVMAETAEEKKENKITWTEAQLDAINSRGRTVLVCAAAGSGKTATLTERIIRRLTDENDPSDISRMVVVTFTRNAATDLKNKIYDALSKKLAQDPQNKFIALQMMKLPQARISTIHSFCYDIVKKNATSLGLGSSVKIGDSAECELMAARIMDNVVCEYYDREERESGVYDFSMLAESLTTTKGENTLSEIFLSLYKKLCSYPGGAYNISKIAGDYESLMGMEFFDTKYGQVYKKHTETKLSSLVHKYENTINMLSLANCEHPYLITLEQDLCTIRKALEAVPFGYEKTKEAIDSITFNDLKSASSKIACYESKLVSPLRNDTAKSVVKKLKEMYSYTQTEIDDAASKTATLSMTLSKILCEFEERFRAEKRDMGILDYNDLEYYAHKVLWNGEERTDAAREMEALTDEIYIDEYQDVNALQDSIFEAVSNGHNLFMVGDVKQSIYSFRGGEPSIFTSKRDSYGKYDRNEPSCEPCSVFMQNNFRCDKSVISYVNKIFATLLGRAGGRFQYIEEDALVYSKDGGKVSEHETKPKVVLCERAKKTESKSFDAEATYVAEEIVRLLKYEKKNDGTPIKPSDIAILLRSDAKSAPIFKRELERRGVVCECTEKTSPFETPELELVMCMLNSIDNPYRDVYLCGILLSELYSVTLDEIVKIKAENRAAGSLYEALCAYTEAHDWEKGRHFLSEHEKYRRAARTLSVDRLIWNIYLDTGLLRAAVEKYQSTYERRVAKRNCMLVYEYARSFESGAFRGLYSFLEYLRGIIEDGASGEAVSLGSDAVRIMSMHASKGLEFPVCFVSRTAKQFNSRDKSERLLFEPDIGIGFKFRGADGFSVTETPFRHALSIYKNELSCEEEMRILYVALTRARERLYVTAQPDKKSSVAKLIEKADFEAEMFAPDTVASVSRFITGMLLSHRVEEIDIGYEATVIDETVPPTVYSTDDEENSADGVADADKDARTLELLRQRLSYEYPHTALSDMRAKISVSKLHPKVLDTSDDADEIWESKLDFSASPRFKDGKKTSAAADRGSATHLIMQFADFERMAREGVSSELERLISDGFISKESADIAKIEDIERFLESGFYKRISGADKLWREFRFNLRLDASLFSSDEKRKKQLQGEKLLVQGVIDGFFLEGDNIVLFDYKTDYHNEYEMAHPEAAEKKLTDRHAKQLYYYKMALERIFSKRVDEIYIYSLTLGREVRVSIDESVIRKAISEN